MTSRRLPSVQSIKFSPRTQLLMQRLEKHESLPGEEGLPEEVLVSVNTAARCGNNSNNKGKKVFSSSVVDRRSSVAVLELPKTPRQRSRVLQTGGDSSNTKHSPNQISPGRNFDKRSSYIQTIDELPVMTSSSKSLTRQRTTNAAITTSRGGGSFDRRSSYIHRNHHNEKNPTSSSRSSCCSETLLSSSTHSTSTRRMDFAGRINVGPTTTSTSQSSEKNSTTNKKTMKARSCNLVSLLVSPKTTSKRKLAIKCDRMLDDFNDDHSDELFSKNKNSSSHTFKTWGSSSTSSFHLEDNNSCCNSAITKHSTTCDESNNGSFNNSRDSFNWVSTSSSYVDDEDNNSEAAVDQEDEEEESLGSFGEHIAIDEEGPAAEHHGSNSSGTKLKNRSLSSFFSATATPKSNTKKISSNLSLTSLLSSSISIGDNSRGCQSEMNLGSTLRSDNMRKQATRTSLLKNKKSSFLTNPTLKTKKSSRTKNNKSLSSHIGSNASNNNERYSSNWGNSSLADNSRGCQSESMAALRSKNNKNLALLMENNAADCDKEEEEEDAMSLFSLLMNKSVGALESIYDDCQSTNNPIEPSQLENKRSLIFTNLLSLS